MEDYEPKNGNKSDVVRLAMTNSPVNGYVSKRLCSMGLGEKFDLGVPEKVEGNSSNKESQFSSDVKENPLRRK
ncbi:MAG: hypothetical protein ABEK36_06520 [Candidatus Aenigmatarchaeota archaeon]